jgi:hypothetical protein
MAKPFMAPVNLQRPDRHRRSKTAGLAPQRLTLHNWWVKLAISTPLLETRLAGKTRDETYSE